MSNWQSILPDIVGGLPPDWDRIAQAAIDAMTAEDDPE